jgi:hypothetical protein
MISVEYKRYFEQKDKTLTNEEIVDCKKVSKIFVLCLNEVNGLVDQVNSLKGFLKSLNNHISLQTECFSSTKKDSLKTKLLEKLMIINRKK